IQNVVLEVEQGYYNYLDAKSQLDAAESAEKEAREGLHAAKRRHEVGVATVADVLQAQTAVSQAELNRQTVAGQIETLRGALATSMGLPANMSFEVGELPASVPTEKVAVAVDDLIEGSLKRRPDLLAARWQAEKAMAKVDTVKAQAMPKFSVTANGNRVYYRLETGTPYSDNWSAQLSVAFPLFTGFANTFDLMKAKADAESSRTQVATMQQQVILDVWTAHSNLKTAAQRVRTTADLLASASESERVMLARYKEGVATILDLLTAQATLASARSQEIQARTDWLLAIAELAHATGGLQPPPENETATGSAPPTRESP
ncbi:MAG: TolC family protein, partial [Deinococcales bacterium]